jgi:hypothetical protein
MACSQITMAEDEIEVSALIDRPEHVHAIGMLTVEISNLERYLSDLFGAMLGIHALIAETIYFTPKAAMARMDVISNVASLCLQPFPKHLKAVNRIIERAKAAMGKRHRLIHDAWVLSEDGNEVARIESPFLQAPKTVTLAELRQTVEQIQKLNNNVNALRVKIQEDPSVAALQRKLAALWIPPEPSDCAETNPATSQSQPQP